jgi:hypothetical protein
MIQGLIIKETLNDESLLDHLTIDKVEIWKTDNAIRYWTMIWFTSEEIDFAERLSRVILEGWFADMKEGNTKLIVFRDDVLRYEIGNAEEKEAVLDGCRRHGIPEHQLNWEE